MNFLLGNVMRARDHIRHLNFLKSAGMAAVFSFALTGASTCVAQQASAAGWWETPDSEKTAATLRRNAQSASSVYRATAAQEPARLAPPQAPATIPIPLRKSIPADVLKEAAADARVKSGAGKAETSRKKASTKPDIALPLRKPQVLASATQSGGQAKLLVTAAAAAGVAAENALVKAPDQVAEEKKPAPIKITPTLFVKVDLSTQSMKVIADGKLKHSWPISSGRGKYKTPNGVYKPTWRSRMHYSRQWDLAPMPYSLFFHNGYAIHGTKAVRALGRPASHGCVRLATGNAKRLWQLVSRHSMAATKITVSGKTPVYVPRARTKVASTSRRRTRRNKLAYASNKVRRVKPAPRRRAKRPRRKKVFWPFDI